MFFDFRPYNSVFCLFIVYLTTKLAHKNCERGRKCTYDFIMELLHTPRGSTRWILNANSFSLLQRFNVVRLSLSARPRKPRKNKKGWKFSILLLFAFFFCFLSLSTPFSFNSWIFRKNNNFPFVGFYSSNFQRWLWNRSLLIFSGSLLHTRRGASLAFLWFNTAFIWFLITTTTTRRGWQGEAKKWKNSDKHVFANFICHGYISLPFSIFMFIVFRLQNHFGSTFMALGWNSKWRAGWMSERKEQIPKII